jgi:hypothetical protein
MKATSQYISALEELKNATTSGKINWLRIGSDSYSYKTINDDLEDIIICFTRVDNDFILSLEKKDFESTNSIMNLDTSNTDQELLENLSELFDIVEYHVDLKNLEGLNEFVDLVNKGKTNQSILD